MSSRGSPVQPGEPEIQVLEFRLNTEIQEPEMSPEIVVSSLENTAGSLLLAATPPSPKMAREARKPMPSPVDPIEIAVPKSPVLSFKTESPALPKPEVRDPPTFENSTSSPPKSPLVGFPPPTSPTLPRSSSRMTTSPNNEVTYTATLMKYSTGSGMWGAKNWRERWFVANAEGLRYFGSASDDKPKGEITWDCVVDVKSDVTVLEHEAAVGAGCFYFAIYFHRKGNNKDEFALLLKASSDAEREACLGAVGCYVPHLMRDIMGDIDDDDDDDDPTSPLDSSSKRERTKSTLELPLSGGLSVTTRRRSLSETVATFGLVETATSLGTLAVSMTMSQVGSVSNRIVSSCLGTVRQLVSKKKLRYTKDGFDLDLVYVTPRLIAMGFPATGREAIYRNNREDVCTFLRNYHGVKYKVYNLCAERSYPPDTFDGKFSHYPFPDHNPPPLELFRTMVEDIRTLLVSDVQNVAAIHCKAGKGRTGCVIAAFLVATGESPSAHDAMTLFGEQRTRNKSGITIPSQRRYVGYVEQLVRAHAWIIPTCPVVLCAVSFSAVSRDITPNSFLLISNHNGTLLDTRSMIPGPISLPAGPRALPLVMDIRSAVVVVDKDFKLEVFAPQAVRGAKRVACAWLHTMFLPPTMSLSLPLSELDIAVKDLKTHTFFPPEFTMTVSYQPATTTKK